MTRDIRLLTGLSLLAPAIVLLAAFDTAGSTQNVLVVAGVLGVLLYAGVWLAWRPTRFEIDDKSLRIVWPWRLRTIPRAGIANVRVVSGADFRAEYGLSIRIGAGRLWGGFGLLKTRRTTFSMWILRTDRLVIVELRGARPLLLTPETPERFVAALAG